MTDSRSVRAWQQEIRLQFEAEVGSWPGTLEPVLQMDPEITQALARFVRVPFTSGPLPRKFKHLILLAVNASATLLHKESIRAEIRNALAAGASQEEILETLELTSVIGIHTCTTGIPILMEELQSTGNMAETSLSERQKTIKSSFVDGRGYWTDFLETMLILAPDLLEAYVEYSTVPWKKGHIPPKFKELIYIALDAQTTHLYELGLRQHIRNALNLGATKQEIIEVFCLISGLGFHALTAGCAELSDEMALRSPHS
jgi:alkylhydroperoxidase/carboxymuconolactone decarboxylase family protein YurZ